MAEGWQVEGEGQGILDPVIPEPVLFLGFSGPGPITSLSAQAGPSLDPIT